MVTIRLTKVGKKGESKYRVIVKEKRSRRDGKAIEFLGWYEKRETGENISINKNRYQHWIKNGAVPTPTVHKLMHA